VGSSAADIGSAAEAGGPTGRAAAPEPFGVAVVGCGNISKQYLKHLTRFPDVQVLFCADIDADRAKAQAAAYGVPASGSPEQALEHPDVRLVVNLTIPAAHAEVASAAIAAGKHVWNEKPLAPDVAAGRALLDQARAAGVRVGCAPDTVLGAGIQSARRLIASGAIGTPLSALTLLQGPGPESWHPDPEFLFAKGAGPLFDLGPYYLSVLATLFGPTTRVAAISRRARDTRVIGSGPRQGTEFNVEVPTFISAVAEYAGGQAASLLFSWDSPLHRMGFLEITGTDATLALPDPNQFDGDLKVRRADEREWTVIGSTGAAAGRGSGVVDMVRAIRRGEPHRASGEMALHVLEMMTAIDRSGETAAFEPIESGFAVPEALGEDWDPYVASA
jgi:predicted dehydrogenase